MPKKKSAPTSSGLHVITGDSVELMSDMGGAKHTIRQIVQGYKLLYPDEYEAVVKMVREKRGLLADEKFGTDKSGGSQRGLFEIPELIHQSIVDLLSDDQLLWFKTGTKLEPNAGGRWFAKTFPEFALPNQI